jgi:hypothetical protein
MKRVRCKLQSRPDRLNKIKIDTIEFQTTSSEKESRLQEQENIVGETKRKEDRFGEKRIASKKKDTKILEMRKYKKGSSKKVLLIMMICKDFR